MFDYTELVERGVYHSSNIVNKSTLEMKRRDYQAYASIYTYSEDVIEYITNNKTIEYYDGVIAASFLWFDIDDSKNQMNAIDMTIEVLTALQRDYGLNPDSCVIYFSGKKGFHLGINVKVFGAEDYQSQTLNKVFKEMVAHIVRADINDRGVYSKPGIDFKIFDKTRILRLPLSKHQDTGMYKVVIPYNLILEKNLQAIKELSSNCVSQLTYKINNSRNENLVNLFKYCIDKVNNQDLPQTIQQGNAISTSTSIFKIPDKGERNDTLFRQAFRLFSMPQLKNNEVIDIMRIICELTNVYSLNSGEDAIDFTEFQKLLNSAWRRANPSATSKISVKSFEDLTVNIYNFFKTYKFVPTYYEEIDVDLSEIPGEEGGLVITNSYSIIGKGGTKKSVVTQDMAIKNILKNSTDILFFNMEMAESEFYKRGISMATQMQFVQMIKQGAINDENIEKIYHDIASIFNSHFQIVSDANLTLTDIETAIDMAQDKIKRKISLIVLDSMNAMHLEDDNELITAVKISKGVKEIAKKKEVASILINHVTQACPYHLKDTSLYVRGGAKVIDNCDAYFCTSLIIDKDKSNLGRGDDRDVKYVPHLLNLRFVNKRGTGKHYDIELGVNSDVSIYRATNVKA